MQPEEYIAAPTFAGVKSSYVFRTGTKGTGYYLDYAGACAAQATPSSAAAADDDAALAAELQDIGLTPEQVDAVTLGLGLQEAVETPQSVAKRAEAAFADAGKLTRVGGAGAAGAGAAAPPAEPAAGVSAGGGVSGGGGSAGYDHLRPEALEKYQECVALYTQALQHTPEEPGDPDLSGAERCQYFSGRAEARIRLEHYGAAVRDCDAAIGLASGAAEAALKRKRRAASMASKIARRAEDTAKSTLVTAAETIEQNEELTKQLADLDPETAKGGLKSMTLMAAVTKLKNRGNDAFKAKRWAGAAEDYTAGIVVITLAKEDARKQRMADRQAHLELDGDDYVSEIVETVEVAEAWPGEALNLRNLYGNHAAALIAMDDWKAAEEEASNALELDCMWGKARYRLGVAMEGCAEDELCGGPERRDAAVAKFREAHGAYAGALALAEGADKVSVAAMQRVERRLQGLDAALGGVEPPA